MSRRLTLISLCLTIIATLLIVGYAGRAPASELDRILATPQAPQTPQPAKPDPTASPNPSVAPAQTDRCEGTNQEIGRCLATVYGWTGAQWEALDWIVVHESHWQTNASNRSCYGIPQACPGRKMATAGADWRTNPATQIRWMLSYVQGRYRDPLGAKSHWVRRHWY